MTAAFYVVIIAGIILACVVFHQEKELRQLRKPAPICGCKHHLSYHDKKTGQCNNYEPGVQVIATGAKVTCKCRQYVGPEPLACIYAPEITDN